MPEPPLNDALLYLRNAVVDTTGTPTVNIRTIDDANAAVVDNTQTVTATHTQDNVKRTFTPAGTSNAVRNSDAFWGVGWAIPPVDFTPTDSRCKAFLPAGTVQVQAVGTVARSATPLADTGNVFIDAALFKYKVAANTATYISHSASAPLTHALLLNASVAFNTPINITIPAGGITFESDEILLVQMGIDTGAMGNPLTGTITYTWTLSIDTNAATRMAPSGSGLRVKCAVASSAAIDLTPSFEDKLTMHRSLTGALSLASAVEDLLTMRRSFTAALNLDGAYDRVLTMRRSFAAALDLTAQRVVRKTILGRDTLKAALSLTGERQAWTIRLGRAGLKGALDLDGAFGKGLHKFWTAPLDLNGAFARAVTVRRTFTGSVTFTAAWFVKLPQAVLNRMAGGGTTIIRRIIRIFED